MAAIDHGNQDERLHALGLEEGFFRLRLRRKLGYPWDMNSPQPVQLLYRPRKGLSTQSLLSTHLRGNARSTPLMRIIHLGFVIVGEKEIAAVHAGKFTNGLQ